MEHKCLRCGGWCHPTELYCLCCQWVAYQEMSIESKHLCFGPMNNQIKGDYATTKTGNS